MKEENIGYFEYLTRTVEMLSEFVGYALCQRKTEITICNNVHPLSYTKSLEAAGVSDYNRIIDLQAEQMKFINISKEEKGWFNDLQSFVYDSLAAHNKFTCSSYMTQFHVIINTGKTETKKKFSRFYDWISKHEFNKIFVIKEIASTGSPTSDFDIVSKNWNTGKYEPRYCEVFCFTPRYVDCDIKGEIKDRSIKMIDSMLEILDYNRWMIRNKASKDIVSPQGLRVAGITHNGYAMLRSEAEISHSMKQLEQSIVLLSRLLKHLDYTERGLRSLRGRILYFVENGYHSNIKEDLLERLSYMRMDFANLENTVEDVESKSIFQYLQMHTDYRLTKYLNIGYIPRCIAVFLYALVLNDKNSISRVLRKNHLLKQSIKLAESAKEQHKRFLEKEEVEKTPKK